MGKDISIVLAGGGTAGHVNPLLATAQALRDLDPQLRITAVGTEKGLEVDLVPAAGFPLEFIPRIPFPRRINRQFFSFPRDFYKSLQSCRALLENLQADIVVGFGGYAAAPLYLAAQKNQLPIVVHEANARPGLANKLGARYGELVALTFSATDLRARRGRTIVSGLPLRSNIALLAKDISYRESKRLAAAAEFGLEANKPILVVTGGSSGALHINEVIAEVASNFLAAGVQILHITGKGKAQAVQEELSRQGISSDSPYRVVEYLVDMEKAYALADLVVTRSGAGMVAETSALGIPAIFVPLPIGNGEQALNAHDVVSAGGALLVENKSFTPEWVKEEVIPLFSAKELAKMSAAARSISPLDAAKELAAQIVEIAR